MLGDGLAEHTTASIPTHTVAGLNLDHGMLHFLGKKRGRYPRPGMAETYGCPIRNSAQTKLTC